MCLPVESRDASDSLRPVRDAGIVLRSLSRLGKRNRLQRVRNVAKRCGVRWIADAGG